ncbi:DUF6352 family protein [Hoeflea sp. YIM 152468]|uniref:DUF6352 family protein n=1 Tax=Hoeflea sp. YIM 152468 TaxID=3031759 RepID=UPI0023DA16F0|nr:DUF6352 family protein [Hoeflea sp. YIM 152468]MDF1606841.1 DUF6352 family protein [Hoeflea sp. YIM 152468]
MRETDRVQDVIWKSAGQHLTHRLENGWLAVSEDFLRAYYTRPEIHPVEESCSVEHVLFERLMEAPFAPVGEDELAAIADPDAAANYALVLRFRDHLVAKGSIEAAYASMFAPGAPLIPPVFIGQMVHLIMGNMLMGETDATVARASELFFRDQTATTSNERMMFADAEVVETRAQQAALLALTDPGRTEVALDILNAEGAEEYWPRADHFDLALDFRFAEPGQDAFARLIERWIKHFLDLRVRVQPLQSVKDERWSWHIGLDAEATRIMNALYEGEFLPEKGQGSIVALFRMEFLDQDRIVERMRRKPAFLGMAVDAHDRIRMKPQNLLINLPLNPVVQ